MSPSTRRVWIEIGNNIADNQISKSPSTRRVWIEISGDECSIIIEDGSPSTRRVWIEIELQ